MVTVPGISCFDWKGNCFQSQRMKPLQHVDTQLKLNLNYHIIHSIFTGAAKFWRKPTLVVSFTFLSSSWKMSPRLDYFGPNVLLLLSYRCWCVSLLSRHFENKAIFSLLKKWEYLRFVFIYFYWGWRKKKPPTLYITLSVTNSTCYCNLFV